MVLIITSCSPQENTTKDSRAYLKPVNWIIGDYLFRSEFGTYYESWTMEDSLTYKGFGYFMAIDDQDTLYKQIMKWRQTEKGVFMYIQLKDQKDDKAGEFKLTKEERNVYTFENPFRDYPSIVTYKLLSDTAVNVIMYGFRSKEELKEDFIMTRQK